MLDMLRATLHKQRNNFAASVHPLSFYFEKGALTVLPATFLGWIWGKFEVARDFARCVKCSVKRRNIGPCIPVENYYLDKLVYTTHFSFVFQSTRNGFKMADHVASDSFTPLRLTESPFLQYPPGQSHPP